ncbi:MAG: hypothetical protein KJ938_00420 [Actinobacteria bacterium]|nr:hypothetical protein [Actinomycetota bacterium]
MTLQQPDGPIIIVGIRDSRLAWLGVAGMWAGPIAIVVYWLFDLITRGYHRGGTERGVLYAAAVVLLLCAVPALVRSYRSRGSVGWILERRGVALPRGPEVVSIPWLAITGVDLSDYKYRAKGRSMLITWLVIRTSTPDEFAPARDLRALCNQLGHDATVVVGVHKLKARPQAVLSQLCALLDSPSSRDALGTTAQVTEQACAAFPEPDGPQDRGRLDVDQI